MEIDENDILFTNAFIHTPVYYYEDQEDTTDFEKYYKVQNQRELFLDELDVADNKEDKGGVKRYLQKVNTYASIDSRDRNKIEYPLSSHFKIFLGRTFYNVESIRLSSIEFPNTDAVINKTNNKIYWTNEEDIIDNIIDTVTQTYPVYSVELRIGSYTASRLETEIESKMNLVKRRNKTGDFHYFDVHLDIETDVVSFTSLLLTQLDPDPFSTISGTGIINVSLVNHGYSTGDIIYIVGARQLAGILNTFINGPHEIVVVSDDIFQFEIQLKANLTEEGGGSNAKVGKLAPFKLLYGEYQNTIAQNIGYSNENSSEQVVTHIKSVNNIYQVQIVLASPHNLLETDIGGTCVIVSSGTTPNIDGTRVITFILSPTTFLVSVNDNITVSSVGTGQVFFGLDSHFINSIQDVRSDTILLETFTKHNYTHVNNGETIVLYDTVSQPSMDGDNVIFSVLDDTNIIVYGNLLQGGNVNASVLGEAGYTLMYKPLAHKYVQVTNVVTGTVTTIEAPGHGLATGDKVKLYNVYTTPSLIERTNGVHTVFSVANDDMFTIEFKTTQVDLSSIEEGEAYIGTSTLTLTFPNHGLNTIISITNSSPGFLLVQTFLPHNLSNGETIRIMQTNSVPVIDDGGYIISSVPSIDSFIISFPISLISPSTYGIIGMSLDFYLYGSARLFGFSHDVLTNSKFYVREIVDENNFTFDIPNYYASERELLGNSRLFISSFFHGFKGVQENTKNGIIERSISLEGENYTFLTSPQLDTMMNTSGIKNVFARIILDQSPGAMIFSFLSTPKVFESVPIERLEELEFSMINHDGSFYEFNDLNYSFVLEISEIRDTSENFNQSSKRGLTNTFTEK